MKLEDCIKKITRYLVSENAQPLLVNIQNTYDLNKIITHFDVNGNEMINASRFCNKDELPRLETVLAKISNGSGRCFLIGLTSFLKFQGEKEVKKYLSSISSDNGCRQIY